MLRITRPVCFCLLVCLAACAVPVKHVPPEPVVPVETPPPPPVAPSPPLLEQDRRALFVAETSQATGIAGSEIEAWLDHAVYQPSVIKAITRPAESKAWKDYRPIFLNDARIQNGRAFLAAHHDELALVQAQTGVPAEIIVAIIGVETSYGANTGSYKVLDALYTLGFFYPKRETFFRSELTHLFALARQENFDLAELRGSYAGAMGWGQFMPSSYRNYAKDGDGDSKRDLFNSPRDAFASIANYFIGYGWQTGQPVVVPAQADVGAIAFVPETWEPIFSLSDLANRGYRPAVPAAADLPATLLTFEGINGPEYWIGYKNFYVITRYNRSPLYAMSVYQLAREIAEGNGTLP